MEYALGVYRACKTGTAIGKESQMGSEPDRPFHPRAARAGIVEAFPGDRQGHADPPRHIRPHGTAADSRRDHGVRERQIADAYETVVDRLLASPRYGERMAMQWLDLARYADTHGYHIDSHRDMWPWRDWVIKAFNSNMPYSDFTVEQLAGDLLPNATRDQKIASAFNRNHMINFEGGAIPEEYLNEYVVDRVDTVSTVWMGMTMGCARCHDHKYDPIKQKEFYQLYAFFKRVPEKGLDGRGGNAEPFLTLPTAEQEAKVKELQSRDQGARESAGRKYRRPCTERVGKNSSTLFHRSHAKDWSRTTHSTAASPIFPETIGTAEC